VDIEYAVTAHLLAMTKAPAIGFDRYIISATTPFTRGDLDDLRRSAAAVVRRRVPHYQQEYARRGWSMFRTLDRVYVNERARTRLGWQPRHDFGTAIERLRRLEDYRSGLAQAIGSKGYHG
jgi:UDP-glucose 4-epimerase